MLKNRTVVHVVFAIGDDDCGDLFDGNSGVLFLERKMITNGWYEKFGINYDSNKPL